MAGAGYARLLCVLVFAGAHDGPALRACLHRPQGLAVDGDGNVVVADLDNRRLRMLTAGRLITLAGKGTRCGHARPLMRHLTWRTRWMQRNRLKLSITRSSKVL